MLRSEAQNRGGPVGWGVGEGVRLGGGEGVRSEAEGAAEGARAAVAGGEDVNVGVANHQGFGGVDGSSGQV